MSMRGKRSPVWNFFTVTSDKKYVLCSLCKKQYKYHQNTTNLKEHLKRVHPASLLVPPTPTDAENVNEDTLSSQISLPSTSGLQNFTSLVSQSQGLSNIEIPRSDTVTQSTSSTSVIQNLVIRSKRTKQLRLYGSSRSNSELTEAQVAEINAALVTMIVLDYQPLRIVEHKGFRRFVRKLNALYKLPSRKMLTSKLIPEMYLTEVEKLRQKLSAVDFVGVTTDLWTSDSTIHYITVTVHFIENNILHASALQTSEVKGSQTGAQIAMELLEIFGKWRISEKIVTVVSDNGANVKSAINDHLHKHHHPCIAHTLNLSVNDCLRGNIELSEIIKKCRLIVGHFKHSALAAEKLKNMQQQMNMAELKVMQDVATRWNSTYMMLQRLIEIKVPITAVMSSLQKAPQMLNPDEWLAVEDCVPSFKLLDLMTTALSGEKYVTPSSIIPLVRGLQHSVKKITCATDIGNKLKNDLIAIIVRRLGSYERDRISAKATFLDPRFKKQGFGSQDTAENAEKWVIEELGGLFAESETRVQPSATVPGPEVHPHPESAKVSDVNMLWEYFDDKVAHATNVTTSSPTAKAILAVKQYLSMPIVPRASNPLDFWSANKNLFPELYRMQTKYLCAPATSVPSERIFSKTGLLANARRNRLSGKHLDKIVFLNTNLEI